MFSDRKVRGHHLYIGSIAWDRRGRYHSACISGHCNCKHWGVNKGRLQKKKKYGIFQPGRRLLAGGMKKKWTGGSIIGENHFLGDLKHFEHTFFFFFYGKWTPLDNPSQPGLENSILFFFEAFPK